MIFSSRNDLLEFSKPVLCRAKFPGFPVFIFRNFLVVLSGKTCRVFPCKYFIFNFAYDEPPPGCAGQGDLLVKLPFQAGWGGVAHLTVEAWHVHKPKEEDTGNGTTTLSSMHF